MIYNLVLHMSPHKLYFNILINQNFPVTDLGFSEAPTCSFTRPIVCFGTSTQSLLSLGIHIAPLITNQFQMKKEHKERLFQGPYFDLIL